MVMMKVIMKAQGEDGKSLSDDDNSNGNADYQPYQINWCHDKKVHQ